MTNYKNKKYIYIIATESKALKYGVGTYMKQLVMCFNKSEYHINIVEIFSNIKDYYCEKNDEICYYKIPFPKKYNNDNWSRKKNELYYKSIFYLIASHTSYNADVYVHFNFVYGHELAVLLKEKLAAKIILTLHYTTWSFELLGNEEKLEQIIRKPENEHEKWVLRQFEMEQKFMQDCCDKVIAIAKHSYVTLNTLYNVSKKKLALIYNTLHNSLDIVPRKDRLALRNQYGFSKNEKLIIFAGRLDMVKGIMELIAAFKLLQEEHPNVRLIVVGDGSITKCFENANPYWAKVVFTGFISREQLFELHSIADIGIVPSLHEEFGYVALEMMMSKLHIIINNTTGLKEITRNYENKTTVNFKDKTFEERVLMLRDTIKKALITQDKDDRYRKFTIGDQYDFKTFSKKINSLYRAL